MIKDWKQVHNSFVSCIVLSMDNSYLLVGGDTSLKEWNTMGSACGTVKRNWGDIHSNNQITTMYLSKPSTDKSSKMSTNKIEEKTG